MSQILLRLNEKMATLNRPPRRLIFTDSDVENYHKPIFGVSNNGKIIILVQSREVKQIARTQKTRANWVLTANISPNGGDLRLKGFDYWNGDFRGTGGRILGAHRLTLWEDSFQIFKPGTDEMILWDLSNFCELILDADALLNASLSNSGTSILTAKVHLEQSAGNIYQNFGTIAENSQIRHNTEVVFADNQIALVSLSISKDELYVTLVNEERNLNGNAMETNRVTPKSTNALEEGTLTMTQTDNSGAPLRASLPAVMGCVQWGDDALERNLTKAEGSCITIQPSANANGHRQTVAIIWTGKGRDSYWSNPLNWSGDRVPTQGDRVVFDSTSSKSVIFNICPQIKSLTITSDYTGTFSGWNDLMVSENVLIQGGTININLEIEGDLAIENGTVNSYLSIGGNLAICNGSVDWNGGKIGGNVTLSGGIVSFSSDYNSYYILNGDFTRTGGTISGQPIFCFHGTRLQIFEPGEGEMTLRDLYNFSELILDGEIRLSGIFCNNGTLTVVNKAMLDARNVNFFSNSGTIAVQGTILHKEQEAIALAPKEPLRDRPRFANAETDDNPVTSPVSDNPLYLNSIKEELKGKCPDNKNTTDPKLHHFQTAAIV